MHAEFVDRDRLFREADFISLHVPLLPDTRHLISRENLEKMKRTAYLVNTSRGPVVDEAALAEALEKKKIAGAALDVYEHEPQVHPALVARRDVILAPHIASASMDTRTKMAVMAAENVVALFEGRRPPNALNARCVGLEMTRSRRIEANKRLASLRAIFQWRTPLARRMNPNTFLDTTARFSAAEAELDRRGSLISAGGSSRLICADFAKSWRSRSEKPRWRWREACRKF